ncbi:putative interferon-induced gtp-binding protein mx [Diaporthe ampelina]|uniref:Putative interferon-induced gtp-binding protein mx n=1 Tax=Diaporthe ampelina TaxID=1214573 RepID=A0A0G2FIJ5_9PEZI|nr:putative interferon-induced gtp-binding protein mx [Diaporthe ampelina]
MGSNITNGINANSSLEDLQTDEQRRVLDTVSKVRKNDNLFTRLATEISLRREPTDSLELKIIPDEKRPKPEQEKMTSFSESIADLNDLPQIMDKAMSIMVISDGRRARGYPEH